MNEKRTALRKLVYTALCLALALVLPMLTGQIPQIGNALSPMHIPVFLCGFICGWPYGLVLGAAAPLLRSLLFGMPPLFPKALAMALELASYGFLSGFLYRLFPKKLPYLYASLVLAMVGGRLVWGGARYVFAGLSGTSFSFAMFLSGAVTTAVPGIILHLVLIPILVLALERAGVKKKIQSEKENES